MSVEFAGIGPTARSPYPRAGGIIRVRVPPTFIPANPSSQPLITCPAPRVNVNGLPPCALVESNTAPSANEPLYCTEIISPALATAPVPTTSSVIESLSESIEVPDDGRVEVLTVVV